MSVTSAPGDHPTSPSLLDKAGREVIFKHISLTPTSSLMAQNGNYSADHPGLGDRLYLNMNWEKPRQRCWQLWCVLRGMHRCYHSLSYARTVRWKPLPGTVLGLSLLTHTQTHTQSQAEILLWGFSNYPQWMGGSRTQGGLTAWVITHTTKTPHYSSEYTIFSFHLWFIFPQRAWGIWEA